MRLARIAGAAVVGLTAVGVGYALDEPAVATADARGPGLVTVEVDIDHSRFDLEDLRVHEGTLVRFVVRNNDPISHELVVGPEAVHRRHERGTDSQHPPIPGEVSVGPLETGLTTYLFDEAGAVEVACHLPGHLEYGMVAEIDVLPLPAG